MTNYLLLNMILLRHESTDSRHMCVLVRGGCTLTPNCIHPPHKKISRSDIVP